MAGRIPLQDWLKESGGFGLDDLDLADFPATGRGLRTNRAFKEGDRILTIASKCLWTVKHALQDPILGPALSSLQPQLSVEDTLAMFLLFVRARKTGYENMRLHIEALPKKYGSSIFFSEEQLAECAGSSLYTVTKQLESQIEEGYRDILGRLFVQHPDLFPLEKCSIDDYKWALCTIWSRGMDFALPDGSSVRLIAPFADMANHSSDVKQCHSYDPSTGDLTIFAGKDYQPGDQVFIYYGAVPNNRLLRLYGFTIPNNPYDSYDLVLSTHPMAPFYEQKCRFWVSAGLDTSFTAPLTLQDPLPKSVLRYLRIQRGDESDIAALAMQQIDGSYGKVSDGNETQVVQSLVESFDSLLQGFSEPLETLEKRLESNSGFGGYSAVAAAQVSVGEQRVLRAARKRAQDMLDALQNGDGRCANCATKADKLMLCGKCKTVKYCERACQVAHFKEHKAACKAAAK